MSESFELFLNKRGDTLSVMALSGHTDFVVDFGDLYDHDDELAKQVLEDPSMLTGDFASLVNVKLKYLNPDLVVGEGAGIRVVLRDLPETVPLRRVGSNHAGRLIQVSGIVVRATSVQPYLMMAAYQCSGCNESILIQQKGSQQIKPVQCPSCNRRRFKLVPEESMFIDSQVVTLQEMPEELPAGSMPRNQRVQLKGHMVDTVRPGDRVTLTGVVKLIAGKGEGRIFSAVMEALHVEAVKEKDLEISAEDMRRINELSTNPWVYRRILQSIAPSIYGLDHIKEAIMYLLFGGVTKEFPDVRVRGDINVLLVGDPGTGKSQLLAYTAMIAPRGLLTSGKGSTAAGLTATVTKGESSEGFVLEAGALVLGDKGVVCVDEMDKMNKEDREAIHMPMEQGIIPIAKAGIVATLNARTSMLAASNPTLGRYNPYQTIAQNISLPVTLLSRFDLVFVLRDLPETEKDAKIADHILNLHKTRGTSISTPIDGDFLRKYISYSKQVEPVITDEVIERFKEFYKSMRKASVEGGEASAISITARQLESLVRMAEARARMHLREEVTVEDAEAAIILMQRSLEQVGIDATTGDIDIDLLYTGKPRSMQMRLQKVLSAISEFEKVSGISKDDELFEALLEDQGMGRAEAARLIGTLMRDGTIYSPRPGFYKRT